MVPPLWKTVWRFLKRLTIELPYDPAIPYLGIYPEKNENTNSKKHMHPTVHSSSIYNNQGIEAHTHVYTQCMYVCIPHSGTRYSVTKKSKIMPFLTMWMDLENIMLSEIRQRKTNTAYITYMCNLKNNINECTHRTKVYRKQTCGCHRGEGSRVEGGG